MAASFCDLPIEVWLLIANYITKSRLSELISVNSFFLNCWMDLRWKQVFIEITSKYSKTLNRLLERMVNPFVAIRVKELYIRLVSKKLGSPKSSNMSFSTTVKAIPLLPNITNLDIELIGHSTFHVATFFQTITSSPVAKTVQKLVLGGHVWAYPSIRESAHQKPFENLTDLVLILSADDNPNKQADPTEYSLILEPLLRSVAPNLHFLSMSTDSKALDLSPLFNALLSQPDTPILFPKLKSLLATFAFNSTFRSSPQSLNSLLFTHKNLQRLRLDLQSSPHSSDDETRLGAYLTDLFNGDCQYPSLQSLTIYPSTSQPGLSAVLSLIKRNASTLSSLSIIKRMLTYEEAKQVVDALTTPNTTEKQLKKLVINLTQLSVSFLDLLAHKFPQLEELGLAVKKIVGSAQYSFYELLFHRRYDNPNITSTKKDVLHTWKLHELSISTFWEHWENNVEAVRAVAVAVPTLSHAMKEYYVDDDDY